MIKQFLYLLLLNFSKLENKSLSHIEEGADSRPETYNSQPEETVRNISLSMEKQHLLHILEDYKVSNYAKLILIENYFGSLSSIASTTNNIFGGGLFKDSDFFNPF